jgi:hypothetical protein
LSEQNFFFSKVVMNAERRAWSFEQWTAYFSRTPPGTLMKEILDDRTIDLNHPVPVVPNNGNLWLGHCTVLSILCGAKSLLVACVVVQNPEVIDWNAIAFKCNGMHTGDEQIVFGTAAALVFDSGCLLARVFRYIDPCSVVKTIPGVCTLSGLECFVDNACNHPRPELCMDSLFHEFDALPMPALHVMAFEAGKNSTAGSLVVLTHIQAHIRWREENMARQRVALWLGGDVKGSKNAVHVLWQGQALGEAIATRMKYSYKQYTEEEEESRKNGQIKKRKI